MYSETAKWSYLDRKVFNDEESCLVLAASCIYDGVRINFEASLIQLSVLVAIEFSSRFSTAAP